jgi:uncharacterized protein VirK/YbjX
MEYMQYANRSGKLQQALSRAHLLVMQRALPLILNAWAHSKLIAVLKLPNIRPLLEMHPRIKYKHLRSNYLISSLAVPDAIKIMRYHYSRMNEMIRPDFFSRLMNDRPVLWDLDIHEQNFKIRISFPYDLNRVERMLDHEGDLSVIFEANGLPLYVLCMTIIPGELATKRWQIGDAKCVLFVGRVQGAPGRFDTLRGATKALMDIAPPRLLLCAVEAIARIFSAEIVVGISAERQLSNQKHESDTENFFDYNTLWANVGAQKVASDLFFVDATFPEKPIENVKQKHRSRTLAKRKFRQAIVEAVEASFLKEFMNLR